MIAQMPEQELIIAQLLLTEDFTFYKTGTRYFGGWNLESDYDYFTPHTCEVVRFLFDREFKDTNTYLIPNLNSTTMRHESGVDVILISKEYADSYRGARDLLKQIPFFQYLPKTERNWWWSEIFTRVAQEKHVYASFTDGVHAG